jgi:hypothetical protein
MKNGQGIIVGHGSNEELNENSQPRTATGYN